MKFSSIGSDRTEAKPGLKGHCPSCGSPTVARCGDVRVWHWAHIGKRMCDSWWENETAWHRLWKNEFPANCQEISQYADNGEKHIADVQTEQGWTLEFQHSYLNPDERRAREAFYPKLFWIMDGTRRKRDDSQFFKSLQSGWQVNGTPFIRRMYVEECTLLRECGESRTPVVFDFGDDSELWCLIPVRPGGFAYVAAISRAELVALHRHGNASDSFDHFAAYLGKLSKIVINYYAQFTLPTSSSLGSRVLNVPLPALPVDPRRRHWFQQYAAFRARSRRRL